MILSDHSADAQRLNKSNRRDVFLVTERLKGRTFVVKRYPNEAEAMHEYSVLKACQGDPHIPRVLDFYAKDDQWHIVMEYIAGDTLNDLLRKVGPFEIERVIDIGVDILLGIQTLHQRGYVHGDLHGGNVIVTDFSSAQTKLVDFQHSAKKLRSGKAKALRQISKPHLMLAPESTTGVLDDKYDIYGVGYMCACMLTGVKLNKSPKEADFESEAHPLLYVIRKAMHKSPWKRYRSAHEMLHALQQLRTRMKAHTSLSSVIRALWGSTSDHPNCLQRNRSIEP